MSNETEQDKLRRQIIEVTAKTHDLLGDTFSQIIGDVETERVVLNIPKAFTYLSAYLGIFSENDSKYVSVWGHHEECFKRKYKGQRNSMRLYLEYMITNQMHEELHKLSTMKHSLLLKGNKLN